MRHGFDRVLLTILDTHVASLIAAAFLFQFGTGAIRVFATTLTLGLLANVFTAVVCRGRCSRSAVSWGRRDWASDACPATGQRSFDSSRAAGALAFSVTIVAACFAPVVTRGGMPVASISLRHRHRS